MGALKKAEKRLDRRLVVAIDKITSDKVDQVCRELRTPIGPWVRDLILKELQNGSNGDSES